MGIVLGLDIFQGGSSKDKELFPQSWEETVSRSPLSHLFPVLQEYFKINTYVRMYAFTHIAPHKARQKVKY